LIGPCHSNLFGQRPFLDAAIALHAIGGVFVCRGVTL